MTGICNETGYYRVNYNGVTGYIDNNHPGLVKSPKDFPYELNKLYSKGDYQIYFYYLADDSSQVKTLDAEAKRILLDIFPADEGRKRKVYLYRSV